MNHWKGEEQAATAGTATRLKKAKLQQLEAKQLEGTIVPCLASSCCSFRADCNLRQGARHFKGTYKGECLTYSLCFFSELFLHWDHMGLYGPIWAQQNQQKINKQLAFIGAFKVPCTLP